AIAEQEAAGARPPKVDPARGKLLGYWGQVRELEEKPAEAIACYRLAVRSAPQEQLNYVRLAYLLRRQTDCDSRARREANHKEADAAIDDLVANNKGSYRALLARWRYRRDFEKLAVRESGARHEKQLDLESAAQDVKRALKAKPDSVDVLLAAADL